MRCGQPTETFLTLSAAMLEKVLLAFSTYLHSSQFRDLAKHVDFPNTFTRDRRSGKQFFLQRDGKIFYKVLLGKTQETGK